MRILHAIHSTDPATGGAIEAMRQFTRVHEQQGHHVEFACLDAPSAPWIAEFGHRIEAFGPSWTGYGYAPRFVPWLRENRARFDTVIISGLWQYSGLGVWRALRGSTTPYFVFPHGMLDPWFQHNYPLKNLKKSLYWLCGEHRVLRDASAVLFTCEEERCLARNTYRPYHCRERVVSLGITDPRPELAESRQQFLTVYPHLAGRRIILFFGRLHEKKGCELLLDAFGRMAEIEPGLHLVMAGPGQADYVTLLQQQAQSFGMSVAERITWTGMLTGPMKWGAFSAAEVFVLPSHQENFGVAVVEALACGVPVLISTAVNIFREVEIDGAGFAATPTAEGAHLLLSRWFALEEAQRVELSRNARNCFLRRFEVTHAADALLRTLRECGVSDRSDETSCRDDLAPLAATSVDSTALAVENQ